MSKSNDPKQFATTVSPKFDNLIRTQAFKLRISLREMLELYQASYLGKLEREKQEKKLKKEQAEQEKNNN